MHLLYDGTWEGLLSSIFECFRLKIEPSAFSDINLYQEGLFDEILEIQTQSKTAERVKEGIVKYSTQAGYQLLYRTFHSEDPNIELLIYHFIKRATSSNFNVIDDMLDDKILKLHQINKKIGREVHRMHAFVRFQELKDGLLVALIEPDFNVLPLSGKHFEKRYPALEWLIYDIKRQYGWYHKDGKSEFINLNQARHAHLSKKILTQEENKFQDLWAQYFKSTNIEERRNDKLHLQHVPKRYWKYLIEKDGF